MNQEPSAEPSFAETAGPNFGVPSHSRRLSDKVLAAFNHAYAAGERDIARQLRAVLADVEARMRALGRKPRDGDALADAGRWTRFVDARDRYHAVKDDPRFESSAVGEALGEMKDAFRSWSLN